MNNQQMYQALKDLAARLDISVSEQNLRQSGLRVQSGFCKVRGRSMFIMDKHKPLAAKVDLLAECLSSQNLEDMYLVPAVRELLEGCRRSRKGTRKRSKGRPQDAAVGPARGGGQTHGHKFT